ncbi:hypothetical protein GAY28_35465 [Azospirillum brasilense]|nr:hypothetical protein [Azospirillum brasilense]
MSSTDHCAASRLTRCMGAVSLVIEPHPEDAGRMRVFVEDAAGQQRSARFNLKPDVAAALRFEADGQFFSVPFAARDWLFSRATELACSPANSRSAA